MKKIPNSPSQANQDSFVMNMLEWKTKGFYLEIGAYHSYNLSNTYSLEQYYDWNGISLEIEKSLCDEFNLNRKNKCFNLNAITTNYLELLQSVNAPKQIDYLQLDIDPAENTLSALKMLPLDLYRFSVITFEHDLYFSEKNFEIQNEAFDILDSYGYKRVIKNLQNGGIPFEDWYIDPSIVKKSIWSSIKLTDVTSQIIFED